MQTPEEREAVVNSLTKEQIDEMEEKKRRIFKWRREAGENLHNRLKAEGRYEGGLDGNRADYHELDVECKRRLKAVLNEYGIEDFKKVE